MSRLSLEVFLGFFMGAALNSGYLYEFGEFTADCGERTLSRAGQLVPVAPKAFDTLLFLLENPGRLLSKTELMEHLWPGTQVEAVNLAHNVSDLRRILGAEAIHTVPKFGYRFTPAVRRSERQAHSEASATSNERSPIVPLPFSALYRKRAKLAATAAILLVLAAAAVYSARVRFSTAARSAPEIRSIAVLPLHSVGGPNPDPYLEFGLTDVLITRLGAISSLAVRPMGAVRRFASPGQDPIDAGRDLKVDAVLDGSLQQQGRAVRVTVRLLRVRDGASVWSDTLDELDIEKDVLLLEDALSARLLSALRPHLGAHGSERLAGRTTASSRAFQFYVEGLYFLGRRDWTDAVKAQKYFEQAVEADRNYAQAYAGLADARLFSGQSSDVVRVALDRALSLDPELAGAHATLGLVAMNMDHDWIRAEAEYRRAIQLNPNLASAHQWYGDYLGYMGRFDRSTHELDQAISLDPLSPVIWSDKCEMLILASKPRDAISTCKYVLEMQPGFAPALSHLVRAYLLDHQPTKALETAVEAVREDDHAAASAALVEAYWAAGEHVRARDLLANLEARRDDHSVPFELAVAYAWMGEKDRSFEWLEQAETIRAGPLINLRMHPFLASLRSDQRYRAMLVRLRMTD
jgi:DNA-binding winged helix-turn-helix (wHTH) protein/TolB-like protein/Tfp pilus assembly protein PilF